MTYNKLYEEILKLLSSKKNVFTVLEQSNQSFKNTVKQATA